MINISQHSRSRLSILMLLRKWAIILLLYILLYTEQVTSLQDVFSRRLASTRFMLCLSRRCRMEISQQWDILIRKMRKLLLLHWHLEKKKMLILFSLRTLMRTDLVCMPRIQRPANTWHLPVICQECSLRNTFFPRNRRKMQFLQTAHWLRLLYQPTSQMLLQTTTTLN